MADFTFVWSLADTHCAICGKENAGEAEWKRNHEDGDHDDDCWCLAYCWESCGFEVAEDELLRLRGLAEAQAAVIARFKDGWQPRERSGVPCWMHDGYLPVHWEQMTSAEQQVIYGEVVKP